MIFSVFDYTCAMIPNDHLLYIKQVKDEPPWNPSTVFRVRVRALFEWQNCTKVAFLFALGAFAVALCINGPLGNSCGFLTVANVAFVPSPWYLARNINVPGISSTRWQIGYSIPIAIYSRDYIGSHDSLSSPGYYTWLTTGESIQHRTVSRGICTFRSAVKL